MDSSSGAPTEGTSIFSLIEMLFLLNVEAVLYLNLVSLPISMIIILLFAYSSVWLLVMDLLLHWADGFHLLTWRPWAGDCVMVVKCLVKVAQSCPTLCDLMDYAVHGILQARILEWVTAPFSRVSSQPRDQTQVSLIVGRLFTSWATREPQEYWSGKPVPSPGDPPDPGIKLESSALLADSLPAELPGKTNHVPWPLAQRLNWPPVLYFRQNSCYWVG